MWYSIDANIANGVASSRNISLGAFPGGYPPCGVPLFQNFDVDMQALSGATSGITEQNKILNKEWGTMVGVTMRYFAPFTSVRYKNVVLFFVYISGMTGRQDLLQTRKKNHHANTSDQLTSQQQQFKRKYHPTKVTNFTVGGNILLLNIQ